MSMQIKAAPVNHVENRATLEVQKKEVALKLLEAWLLNPHLRLGQLLVNAMTGTQKNLFQIEDYDLLALVEQFVAPKREKLQPQVMITLEK